MPGHGELRAAQNRIDPVFSPQARLTAADGAVNDTFGSSVAISGETAVAGVPGDDIGENSGQGSAYVFVRSGGMWTQQARLTALDSFGGDGFGVAVAINEDTIVALDSNTVVVGADLATVGAIVSGTANGRNLKNSQGGW